LKYSGGKIKKILKYSIGIIIFFVVIFIYSWFRTLIDKTSLLISFDKTFSLVIQEIWKFISIPAVFISLAVLIVCWTYNDPIRNIFTKIKEFKYKDFSAAIDLEDRKEFETDQNINPNYDDKIVSMISILGKRTTAVLLEMGDKILSKDDVIKIIRNKGLLKKNIKTDDDSLLVSGYYVGVLESLLVYFAIDLFDIEVSKDKMQAKFNYKPKVQDLLKKRKEELKDR